ncbi:F1F0 ATP synthase assembly protein-like protein Atp11 [Aureobasidium pullulans]|uniref:F1F0 ATP synthase assembly protein-like protein Atp11 n=1 Tax=Aureobasidium pullulans TaxID=5580 RepID=A0A4S9L0L1_AURPU|nr:F1F0 ATP synthase assembly protein-like protein Atp11 [Aureobasidium pullulans]
MASLVSPTRHIARAFAPTTRLTQRRWAQVHDIRFLATHQKPDQRVFDKYKAKLEQKAKQEGHGDVDKLKSAYKEKIVELRQQAIVPGANAPLDAVASNPKTPNAPFQVPPPPQPQSQQSQAKKPSPSAEEKAGIKTLSSFIDVAKTKELPQKEIEYIWRLRHASSPSSLCAVVPTPTYQQIVETARKHPQFVLPLPKEGQGAEIHFLQWTFPSPTTCTVLFTALAEFKLKGEFAQPHTTITHHLDLAHDKGLVLLEGTVLEDKQVTVEEGKWLLMCLQKFYGKAAEQSPRRKLMEQFSQGDSSFKIDELLEEAEKF